MAPKSPKRSVRKVQAKIVRTPDEDRQERSRRRGDQRDADDDDDQDESEDEESADLQLQGVNGLSTEEAEEVK